MKNKSTLPKNNKLEQKKNKGDEKEREIAKVVEPIIKNHHLLLVTLLVANAAGFCVRVCVLCES